MDQHRAPSIGMLLVLALVATTAAHFVQRTPPPRTEAAPFLPAPRPPSPEPVTPAELETARHLGIVDAIQSVRPSLRLDLVERIATALVREAHRQALDPLLLAAVARVESAFDPWATSAAGARGLLQVMVPTGTALLSDSGATLRTPLELYDVETNVALGARYLAWLLERFEDPARALVAYNRGPAGARRALAGSDAAKVLAGYPRRVLDERTRLAAALPEKAAVTELHIEPAALPGGLQSGFGADSARRP